MARTTGLELWNTGTLIACAVLLGFLIWRIDLMDENLHERPALSGQTVTREGVTTERYIDEPLDRWYGRHMDAMRTFADKAGSDE